MSGVALLAHQLQRVRRNRLCRILRLGVRLLCALQRSGLDAFGCLASCLLRLVHSNLRTL
eukprot:3601470-Pleurochrysis_carterae.AAC.1